MSHRIWIRGMTAWAFVGVVAGIALYPVIRASASGCKQSKNCLSAATCNIAEDCDSKRICQENSICLDVSQGAVDCVVTTLTRSCTQLGTHTASSCQTDSNDSDCDGNTTEKLCLTGTVVGTIQEGTFDFMNDDGACP